MNLPEHLKKKREDTGELFDRSSWYGRRSLDYFDAGYDAACAELLPMIDRILMYCEPHMDKMWAAYIVSEILKCDFRDSAQELKKWVES